MAKDITVKQRGKYPHKQEKGRLERTGHTIVSSGKVSVIKDGYTHYITYTPKDAG